MCGRYGFTDPAKLKQRYDLQDNPDLKPRYNIAPSQSIPVITKNGIKHAEIMRWGLIPFWAKDISIGNRMINARAEGIEEKPAFRKPFRSQRCLVPASYFFEWLKTPEGKIPYLIKLKGREIFSFAGLYDVIKGAEDKEIKSYTIITTASNDVTGKIHDRMPVILSAEEENLWLDKETEDTALLLKMLDPYPADEMEAYPVSKLVNDPLADSPEIINSA